MNVIHSILLRVIGELKKFEEQIYKGLTGSKEK